MAPTNSNSNNNNNPGPSVRGRGTPGPRSVRGVRGVRAGRTLETGVLADAVVICGDRKWNVHKITLMSRSDWFAEAIKHANPTIKAEFNLGMDYTPDDVNAILDAIYGKRLPEECYNPANTQYSNLVNFVNFFNMGVFFGIEPMRNDALTLLGQLCDRNLKFICSYDRILSNSQGVFDPLNVIKNISLSGLLFALHAAFIKKETYPDLSAQCLLANYIYAARGVLLSTPNIVKDLVDKNRDIQAALWQASQGRDLAGWLPDRRIIVERHNQLDHTKKTQHPDRCETCDDTFDGAQRKRVMYDPHKIVMRPVAYCLSCVVRNEGEKQVIFRKMGKTDRAGGNGGLLVGDEGGGEGEVRVKVEGGRGRDRDRGDLQSWVSD
ncbi:hypothetical protein QBC38DRAFT_524220 [Podospora fimiseda]|uniref:BTB domain-containing protein n=1 Tax=Podospora fimiseda TaxID=252190 RepID=A0AAN6YLV7_9PEZI|nr:hypothetical protein QBC38DRAFT_524220 [Podospora fimiseda]